MATLVRSALLAAALAAFPISALPTNEPRDVDTRYPYKGPTVPIADWVDQTVDGNGKGFYRVSEPPAVKPMKGNPTNNINVINMAYLPGGMNIHFQTAFGLNGAPTIMWGKYPSNLNQMATGTTTTYDREPPCSAYASATDCSQFFHNVPITGLKSGTTYYYKILASNGTTSSPVLKFITGQAAGSNGAFTAALLNDMGYTNAQGTYKMLNQLADEGVAFALHGGDTSYADDWFEGILPCQDGYGCYNGTDSYLPPGDYPKVYNKPLPAGEIPNQGGPFGGDVSTIYESNWDIWQQWMNKFTMRVPYMINPGNHEAACAEFDGPGNPLTALLNYDELNSTAPEEDLTYYSCPPSQRNFTAYQHRFHMPGEETGGRSNFWYSFDYGLVHFISFDAETDYAYSPESPFLKVTNGQNSTPTEEETYITNSGPFGFIEGGGTQVFNTSAYEQYQWMVKDLASVDRKKTPWIIASSHRPMYSSQVSKYQARMRAAWEELFIKNGVDLYVAGHIHWYERLYPLGVNATIDARSIIDQNTYMTNPGVSMTHIVNGMAGNIESHSTLGDDPRLPITAVLNQKQYGFSKLTVFNRTALRMEYMRGDGSGVGDYVTLLKK